jgi:hypothetical protein
MSQQSKLHCTVSNLLALIAALLVLPGGPALAQSSMTPVQDDLLERPEPYSPYVDQNFPKRVLFGDTHVHTIGSSVLLSHFSISLTS